ncbi:MULTISPECIES: right-handed parallel beta-helix repeat-containing protein [Paenibacillus]|uniref:right-handed parallel beta-helix repeat-containing protein n=1 Tax=Paenibacillus TaxID=44249 RepID=UPI002FE1CB4F
MKRRPISKRLPALIALSFLAALALTVPAVLRYLHAPLVLNVKEAGARGDGVTDDTAAFRLILQKAANHKHGADILIPAGTYLLDPEHPLPLRSHIRLIGQGRPVLRFGLPGTDQTGYEALSVTGRRISIEGITIDGAYRLIRGIGVHTGSERVRIRDIVIRQMSQPDNPHSPLYSAVVSGIMIYGGTREVTVENSTISYISAIHPSPVARGIMVWNNPGVPPANQVRIAGNRISHITPREDADAIHFDQAAPGAPLSDSVVENNRIAYSAKRGIKIAAPGVLVRNNVITNPYRGNNRYRFPESDRIPQDMYAAISVYASDVTVSNNIIDGAGTFYAAIEADAGTRSLSRIIIENNDIGASSPGAPSEPPANGTGIRLGRISGARVTGNRIRGMHTGFFLPSGAIDRAEQFRGNDIIDAETDIRYPAEAAQSRGNP